MTKELLISTATKITINLVDINNTPLIGVTAPSIYLQKYNGQVYNVVATGLNWNEVSSSHMPGVYELSLSTFDVDTLGSFKVSIKDNNSKYFFEVFSIVSATLETISPDLILVRRLTSNKTVVDINTFTLNIYDDSGINIIKTFKLYDQTQQPTVESIFSRVPQ
jgi:hypothetical protein